MSAPLPASLADEARALPVAVALPALADALARAANAVLVAPPGAGKTTLAPLALLSAPWRGEGRIVMLEPRRLAARAAARRMAALLGEAVGGRVGFRTRLDSAVSAATRIEVVTEGLLVRRLIADPTLDGVAAVIFDEFHERSLDADLALALCRDLQTALRPELRLLVMSATLDGAAVARLLGADGAPAPVIESAGRAWPVTIRHAARDLADARELPAAMAGAVRRMLAETAADTPPGDLLCFLPGMGEIRRTEALLAEAGLGRGVIVHALHGDLAPAAQDAALAPAAPGTRKVVLASAIAETSLTIEGVRAVIDGGFRRAPRFDPATGLSRLVTLRISRAAAAQRAGRAGRLGPGLCLRLWTEAAERALPPFDRPEMVEADLAGLALDLAAWGAAPETLAFLDPLPAGPFAAARALLAALGAIDADGRITAHGRRMAALGAHPRLAHMLIAAAEQGPAEAALAADLAALLEERDPVRAAPGQEVDADIGLRLALLREGGGRRHLPAGHSADAGALARIRRAAAQARRRLRLPASAPGADAPDDPHAIGALLALAYPERLAQVRPDTPGSYRLAGGGSGVLPVTDALAREPFLVVASLDAAAGRAARIRLAAPIGRAAIEAIFAGRITRRDSVRLDEAGGIVLARRQVLLDALLLEEAPLAKPDPEAVAGALCAVIRARGLSLLDLSPAARSLCARVGWMRRIEGEDAGWPDWSDAGLLAGLEEWLAPHLAGITRLADLSRLDLFAILSGALDWNKRRRLDEALPTHIALPRGGRAPIDYEGPVPTMSARVQHLFGLRATPTLAGGRVPLQVALLSPAGRPVAITADLAGFWARGYAEVRKDLRGRYPKHAWPEDPLAPLPPRDGRPR